LEQELKKKEQALAETAALLVQIVPMLADQGEYIASKSSFYRVLREANRI